MMWAGAVVLAACCRHPRCRADLFFNDRHRPVVQGEWGRHCYTSVDKLQGMIGDGHGLAEAHNNLARVLGMKNTSAGR